jgi:hypothetical protein
MRYHSGAGPTQVEVVFVVDAPIVSPATIPTSAMLLTVADANRAPAAGCRRRRIRHDRQRPRFS